MPGSLYGSRIDFEAVQTATTATRETPRERPSRAEVDPAAVELIRRHGSQVMGTARRYSATREDAEDAYQRAVEILLTRAPSTNTDELVPWLKTVVKHEAFALRRQRARQGVPSQADALEPLAGASPGPAELAERRERLRVGAEALRRLKPQEVRALTLKAQGLSYQEICAATGWTYTKVNRCLSEGRRRFLARVAGIEAGDECERLAPLLSAFADGELGSEDLTALRAHVTGCLACRARLREYRRAPARAAALLLPLPAASLWGWLRHGVVAHKLAAVAASSVLVAGGGAAAVGTLERQTPVAPRVHRHVKPAARPAPRHAASTPRTAAIKEPRAKRISPRPARKPATVAPTPLPQPTSAPSPTPASRAPSKPAPAGSGGEFAP